MGLKDNIKKNAKRMAYSNALLYKLWNGIKSAKKILLPSGNYTLENKGCARIRRDIEGEGHIIQISEGCLLEDTSIYIRGKNNKIVFEENCMVGEECSFWMEGENITIVIGANTTFTYGVHMCAQENDASIVVGKDCMFSNNIILRTSDSHPMYDLHTGKRINSPANVSIGDHVWIAPNTKIMKGAVVGDGTIIGSDTMVSKSIPANVLAVGHPAKVVKTDVTWSRESLF